MRKPAGFLCAFALALVIGVNAPANVTAQTGDPSTLPLLSSDALQYVGGFRLPSGTANGVDFAFGGEPMAFNPATNGLFVGSYLGALAEVSIPTPVNSSNVNALPFATFLQPFADPTEGHLSEVTTSGVMANGLLVYGDRLYGTAAIFYDADNNQRVSHYSRSLQLNQPSFSGWSQVGGEGRSGFVSGWMTAVPSEWQSILGGPTLTGQCCIPIAWRTSWGPSAFAFNPAQVGQAAVAASPLLYYSDAHPTLGSWDGSNPTYGATTSMAGMVLVSGTRTVLYVGRNGLGPHCYGNGTPNRSLDGTYGTDGALLCYDPASSDKGSHAYPYRYQVWAYDLNDFAAVKAGAKQPWEVLPYGVWPLDFPTPEGTIRLGGVAYDSGRQLLYISQRGADEDGYASRPIIHAFRLNVAAGSSNTPPATTVPPVNTVVTNVSIAADKASPQAAGASIAFTAQPAGGVAPYEYKWIVSDGSTSTIAVPWSASNRFVWTPTTENANYRIIVWARSSGNTADAFEATTALAFPVTAPTSTTTTAVTMSANRVAPQPPLTAITWTAVPVGGSAPHQYKWRVFDGATWTVGAGWSPGNSFVWTPSAANANYRVEVWVRGAGNGADAQEASTSTAFPIAAAATDDPTTAPFASVSLVANKPSPQTLGSSITWTATPSGGSGPVLFKWWVAENNAGNTWTTIGGWTSNSTLVWTPTVANPTYRIAVWVKRASNTADQAETAADQSFAIVSATTVTPDPVPAPAPPTPTLPTPPTQVTISAATLTGDKPSPQLAGTSIHFTAGAVGGTAPYQYQWWVFENQQWSAVSTWGAFESLTWSRHAAGDYQIRVNVRSAGSTVESGEATFTLRYTLQ